MFLSKRVELNNYDFLIASAFYPSGASWLYNLLLTLGICVQASHYPAGASWKFISDNIAAPTPFLYDEWARHNPVLYKKKLFYFTDNLFALATHEIPGKIFNFTDKKIILFVRDPRDTVYSYYKRIFPDERVSLELFLKKSTKYDCINFESRYFKTSQKFWFNNYEFFYHNVILRWALWYGLWMQIPDKGNIITVRFEDVKKDSYKEASRILDFLDIKRTDEELIYALNESTFEKASEVEKILENGSNIINRKGVEGEWKNKYDNESLKLFEGLPYFVMNQFGYTEQNPENDSINFFHEKINNFVSDESADLLHLFNFYKILYSDSFDEIKAIPESFIRIFNIYFPIRRILSYQTKEIIANTYLALLMTYVFVRNSTRINLYEYNFEKFDFRIFKALLVLFGKINLNVLKETIPKDLLKEAYSIFLH